MRKFIIASAAALAATISLGVSAASADVVVRLGDGHRGPPARIVHRDHHHHRHCFNRKVVRFHHGHRIVKWERVCR